VASSAAGPRIAKTRWLLAQHSRLTAVASTGSAHRLVSSDGLDRVRRGDQPEDAHDAGEVGVDEAAWASHPGEDVAQSLVVAHHVPDTIGDAAQHDTEHG
jgi:hypothetical protein